MGLKAHIGFSLPETADAGIRIISHFSGLGYRLAEHHDTKWTFHRGSKISSLFRFDIRAYSTVLTVCASPSKLNQTWVSCDWDVWSCMAILTGADVATLEAEGRELESVLRSESVGDHHE